jgi:hypothetical protein
MAERKIYGPDDFKPGACHFRPFQPPHPGCSLDAVWHGFRSVPGKKTRDHSQACSLHLTELESAGYAMIHRRSEWCGYPEARFADEETGCQIDWDHLQVEAARPRRDLK